MMRHLMVSCNVWLVLPCSFFVMAAGMLFDVPQKEGCEVHSISLVVLRILPRNRRWKCVRATIAKLMLITRMKQDKSLCLKEVNLV
jgi:hypothetical protein